MFRVRIKTNSFESFLLKPFFINILDNISKKKHKYAGPPPKMP